MPVPPPTARSGLRSFQQILYRTKWLVLAAAIVVATPSTSNAAWKQDKFLIGTAVGNTFWVPDDASDTTTMIRSMRLLGDNYINTAVAVNWPFDQVLLQSLLTSATSAGIRILLNPGITTSATPLTRSSFSLSQWNSLYGYNLQFEGDRSPNPMSAAYGNMFTTFHAADSTKALYVQLNNTVLTSWVGQPGPGQADAMSLQSYVIEGWPHPYTDHSLYLELMRGAAQAAVAPRSAWMMGNIRSQNLSPPPDDNDLRMMAFAPAICGCKGVIWWSYDEDVPLGSMVGTSTHYFNGEQGGTGWGADFDFLMPTSTAERIRPLNHYLQDVIGPIVMRTTYLGVFHDSSEVGGGMLTPSVAQPDTEPWVYDDPPEIVTASNPVIQKISVGSRGMIGLFQPSVDQDPPGTYYLLVGNRTLHPTSGTIDVKGGTWLGVGAAPSPIGYVGGTGYSPVDTTHLLVDAGGVHYVRFSYSLQGGEARMYRVSPDSSVQRSLGLISPSGGEVWSPGESKTISWAGMSSGITIRLYTDLAGSDSLASGPYPVDLATGVSGTSAVITVPNVTTTRGRIELRGYASDGTLVRALQQAPLKIAPASASGVVTSPGPTFGSFEGTLAVSSSNVPEVTIFGDSTVELHEASWNGVGWEESILPDSPQNFSFVGDYGTGASLAIDSQGNPHASYFTLFPITNPSDQSSSMALRYKSKTGSTWGKADTVDYAGVAVGNTSLSLDPFGEPYIAYNSGSLGGFSLRIQHHESGQWNLVDDEGASLNPYSISTRADSHGALWYAYLTKRTGRLFLSAVKNDAPMALGVIYGDFGGVSVDVGNDGVPAVVYSKAGTTPGSRQLYYRTMTVDTTNWTGTWGPEETIDSSAGTISGLSLYIAGTTTHVGYAMNGVLKTAIRVNGTWTVSIADDGHDAEGPVTMKVALNGDQWFSYWDKAADLARVAQIPAAGGGDGGGGDPGNILHAITFRSANPVRLGSDLVLGLRFSTPAALKMSLFDVAGRRAASHDYRRLSAGQYQLQWRPAGVRAGVYFLRVQVDGRQALGSKVVFVQ